MIPIPTVNTTVPKEEVSLSFEAALESMVLLKNENQILPLSPETRTVALFGGAGAMHTATAGTGAETNYPAYAVSVYQGLKNAGFTIVTEEWLHQYNQAYCKEYASFEYTPWDHFSLEEPLPEQETMDAAAQKTDTAIYVIRRIAGEGKDRKVEEGEYLLSHNEKANLIAICQRFSKVIVLLNTCGPIDLTFLDTLPQIRGILYLSFPGMEAGNAVASLLTGEHNPCGKLSATWAKGYTDYPCAQAFMNTEKQLLTEDIYLGYRWFTTFGQEEKAPYPFGFGLSYTTFDFSHIHYEENRDGFTLSLTVTNTGTMAGKEVVQLYHGAPQGVLGKPARSLLDYQKTKLLAVGESQKITFTVLAQQMASFDDEGQTGHPNCYLLEAGDYPLYLGTSCVNTTLAGVYGQKELVVTQKLKRRVAPVESFEKVVNSQSGKQMAVVKAFPCTAYTAPTKEQSVDALSQYSTRDLAEFTRLHPGRGAGSVGGTWTFPQTVTVADGVSGLNIHFKEKNNASYPCPTALAQTFNDSLVTRVGEAVAQQLLHNGLDNVLAPGVNIQQNPLCGRNFGYFSEDPLLSGRMGAAYVRGVQSQGVGATPKHFAANTKEDNRQTIDTVASARALREIYLKSFELTVKGGNPWSIMTSYNKINGVETAERSDLINGILREEWGFNGLVMTDWSNDSSEILEKKAGCDFNCHGLPPKAGLDVVVPATEQGELPREVLEQAAQSVLQFINHFTRNEETK